MLRFHFFFFFQAEDGIRDLTVTGVQTCALPILMALRVVVLPTPLRPRSVTTSPRRTSNCAPCRMWDSPYHAFRSATESSAVSGMLGAQVGLDHLRMSGHRPVVALGDGLAAREHRDLIREVFHDAEVVLDHEHRSIGCHAPDKRRDALDVRVRHAGSGLVVFYQAEDGIRDLTVTGVQTCALPISSDGVMSATRCKIRFTIPRYSPVLSIRANRLSLNRRRGAALEIRTGSAKMSLADMA